MKDRFAQDMKEGGGPNLQIGIADGASISAERDHPSKAAPHPTKVPDIVFVSVAVVPDSVYDRTMSGQMGKSGKLDEWLQEAQRQHLLLLMR